MSNKLKLKTGNIRSDRFNYLLKNPQKVDEALLMAGLRMERTEMLLRELIKDNVVLEHGNRTCCSMFVSLCGEFGIDIKKVTEEGINMVPLSDAPSADVQPNDKHTITP